MKHLLQSFLIVGLLLLLACSKDKQINNLIVLDGETMGTVYSVKIVKGDLEKTHQSADDIKLSIDSLLNGVNLQMSTYLDTSEITRFNKYDKTDWFSISIDFAFVLKNSLRISKLSRGTFDITVGPLVNLWGFGPENRVTLIPSNKEIDERRKLTGFQKISVRMNPPAVKKVMPEMYLDLSAIAKGYGVDKVTALLENDGIRNFLVDIGGEISTRGINHQGQVWKIGVSTPDEEYGIQKVIPLENKSVATSGDYRNYFEKDGIRYSHTIDPRTARPITHKLTSVTVLHDTCMIADAYATAIDVLGPDDGYNFAVNQELAVFMIVRDSDAFIEKMTPELEKILEVNEIGN